MTSPPLQLPRARAEVLERVVRAPAEPVGLDECEGRVLAAPVLAPRALPPVANSAMDGYAVRAADARPGRRLPIVGESRAGAAAGRRLRAGEAIRISTGAALPAGADAVLRLEDADADADQVQSRLPLAAGAHVREAGEDFAMGNRVLDAGAVLGAAELGALAALGITEVACARRPRLVVLTSGDELASPAGDLGPGQIHDSTGTFLPVLARRAGAAATHAGILPDELEPTVAGIGAALEDADVVVIAGGVSVGRYDYVKPALDALAVRCHFWRVAIRPGGPTWFGSAGADRGRGTLVFGLPGNPVSSITAFQLLIRPALLAAGGRDPSSDRAEATLDEKIPRLADRAFLPRCRVLERSGARWIRRTAERQGSHLLSSMLGADCLALIPAGAEPAPTGERVEIWRL